MLMHKETEARAGGAATEHTESEFHVDDALAATLDRLQVIDAQAPTLSIVIEHACSSYHCMSHRLVAMLRLTH